MAKHHPDLIFCRKQAGVGETASMPAALWVGVVVGAGELGVPVSSWGLALEVPRFPPHGGIGARAFVACDEKWWRACWERAAGEGSRETPRLPRTWKELREGVGLGVYEEKRDEVAQGFL